MPNSDWYTRNSHWIAGVLLLALLVSIGYPSLIEIGYSEGYKDAQTARSSAESYRELYERCFRSDTPEEVFACLEAKIKAVGGEKRAEEELQAQKDAATWALLSFIASAFLGTVTIFITGVGLIYLRDTLKANAGMHETGLKQLAASQRPWVSVDKVEIAEDVKASRRSAVFRLNVTLKCSGYTPAMRVRVLSEPWNSSTGDAEWTKIKDRLIKRIGYPPEWSRTVIPKASHTEKETVIFNAKPSSGKIVPSVIVCVGYEFAFEEGVHFTLETFEISRLGQVIFGLDKDLIPAGEFSVDFRSLSRGYAT